MSIDMSISNLYMYQFVLNIASVYIQYDLYPFLPDMDTIFPL